MYGRDQIPLLRVLVWAAALWIVGEFLWYEQYKLTGNVGSIDGVFQPLANWFGVPAHEEPIRLFVATLGIIASVLVLIPRTRLYGALLALGLMSGAIFFHTLGPIGIDPNGDGGGLFKEACFTWTMAALILVSSATSWQRSPRASACTHAPPEGEEPMLQRPPRDTRLDLLRGWLQLQTLASHAHGSLIGAWGISAAWGLSDSSEQFLFLSGFTLGSVFVLKEHRSGWRAASRDVMLRVARLYRTHLIVVCGFAALVIATEMAFRWPGETAAMGWSWLLAKPWLALPGAATLLYQPEYMGILPVFILCMLGLPLLILGIDRFGAWSLLLSLALYTAVQQWGSHLPGLGGTEVEFNPFAWQILFALGAWFGRRALLQGRAVRRHPLWLAGAVLVLLAGFWVRLVEHGLIAGPPLDLQALMGKQDLTFPRILHALSLAYVVAAMVPPRPVALRGWLPQALAAAGRNSLNVFCLGLFFSYFVASLFLACSVTATGSTCPWSAAGRCC